MSARLLLWVVVLEAAILAAMTSPLTITTTSMPNGVKGTPYTKTFVATGGTGSYTWACISGCIAGLVMNPTTGVYSGTPTAANVYTAVVIRVTDVTLSTTTKTFSATIASGTTGVSLSVSGNVRVEGSTILK